MLSIVTYGIDVLFIKYKAHYVCYVFCYLGHSVERDYPLHASSIQFVQIWCDVTLLKLISYSSLSLSYSPSPVAFHILYKDESVIAVVTTKYCFKQRDGTGCEALGEERVPLTVLR